MSCSLYDQFKPQADVDGIEAIESSVKCLPLFNESVGRCTIEDLVLLNAHAVCSQLGLMTYIIENRLSDIVESLDCAGTRVPDFWMTSYEAAKDKAREIGLDVPIEWTPADLRYKLHQAIYGGDNG